MPYSTKTITTISGNQNTKQYFCVNMGKCIIKTHEKKKLINFEIPFTYSICPRETGE